MLMKNAFTCDVEDYYQVEALKSFISREDWESYPSRVEQNTQKILDVLKKKNVKGTFFILGWLAQRFPQIVKDIAQDGHEIASHGFAHIMITHQSKDEFREDIHRSKSILENLTGQAVYGYRAPSFSITPKTEWALDILIEEGFGYDSSIFPIRHDLYGFPGAAPFLHKIKRNGGAIWEFPPTTLRLFGMNIPIAGGGYLRLLPLPFIRWGFKKINHINQSALVYIHPWEMDPEQPRIKAKFLSRFRHYTNLHKTEKKLKALLNQFSFCPIEDILKDIKGYIR